MKPLHLLLLLPLALLTATTSAADDPWPSFRGHSGTGHLDAELGEGSWTLETRWVHPLGSGYSGLAIGGDLVVTAARRGDWDVVIAFDPEDGSERWHYELEPTYAGHDGSHDGPVATPAIAGGRVFMVGAAGNVAALRLADGGELWTRNLVQDFGSVEPRYGFAGSPAVVGETVVLSVGGDEGSLVGLDVATGELRWRSLPDSIYSGSPIIAEIAGETQVLMLSPTYVTGLDPEDGKVLWQVEHGENYAAMGALSQSVLPLDDERLFIKHGEDRTMVLRVTPQEGGGYSASRLEESRWLTRSYSPPSALGNTLYGYTGRLLSAIDSTTGELLWRSRPPGDGFLLALGDQLAVLTKKGTLHLGQASREGWVESDWVSLFSDLAWAPPSAAGRSVYARSLGEIARVDLVQDGESQAPPQVGLPAALKPLAAEIASGEDAEEVVDGFLEGKQLPWIDGEDVFFLWRGEAEDVAVAGDMIGMRREEVMHRLEGSDLWWWQTQLDRRSRFNYLFFIDEEPTVDPSHWRRTESTFLGADMNWQGSEVLQMSWFAMPEWPGLRSSGKGYFESIEVELPEAGSRRFPVWLPPGYDENSEEHYPVVYVHHPRALAVGQWAETLDRVVGRTVAPVVVVFLDDVPGPPFVALMRGSGGWLDTLVPAVDARFRTRPEANARANVGMGLHVQPALVATFQNPGVFGRLGVQSYFGIEQQMAELTELVGELNSSELPLRVYLEWGKWDLFSSHEAADVRKSGRWLHAFLRERGWQVLGGEMPDSTDFASWSQRTDLLLQTLFPIDGELPHEELQHWLGADEAADQE